MTSIPLTPADAAWLHMEKPDNLMMITGLVFLQGELDWERLRATLQHRLCFHSRFRSRVVEPSHGLGLPCWEPVGEVDLNRHLVREDCPPEVFLPRVGELMSEALPREFPLWEFRVFPGQGEGTGVLIRLHHAIGDGISLMRVLLGLCDTEEDAAWPEPLVARPRPRPAGVWQRARRMARLALREGHDLIFDPTHTATASLARVLTLPPDALSCLKGELTREKRAALSPPYPLAEIKQLSRRLGCTINDLLMTALAGALGRCLRRFQSVPAEMSLRVVVPVDLRGGDGQELSNQFGLVFLVLPVGEEDAAQRLVRVRQAMASLKNSPEALVTYELLSAVGLTPAELERAIIDWFGNKATAVVTNLPGPQQPLYLGGARLESVMYWVPQSGRLGLGVSILSYNGRVRMGIASDAGLLPHPEWLQEDFALAYQEMHGL